MKVPSSKFQAPRSNVAASREDAAWSRNGLAPVRHSRDAATNIRIRLRANAGVVLLEVVLALVLIAGAAAVIGAGLSASIDRVERLKLNAHAADLAVSVLSELQMGSKVIPEDGPEPFEVPFENWTWEALTEMTDEKVRDTGRTKKIEVVIRHEDPPLVYRLAQVIRLPEKEEDVLLEFGF